jgi:hypothetical protein
MGLRRKTSRTAEAKNGDRPPKKRRERSDSNDILK